MQEFLTLYPGLYLPEERAVLEKCQEQVKQNLSRADLSFKELIKTSDGIGQGVAYKVPVTAEEVQARMYKVDPENPIWFDEAYALESSYEKLPAPVYWSCPKGGYFPGLSASFGDVTTVKEHHHSCRIHRPIYQGDTLYPVVVDQCIYDATPIGGSTFRTWALRGSAKIYNQDGELVMTQICGVKECFKIYADPARRTWNARNVGAVDTEFVNHKIHVYTDEDWETIRGLWAQEYRRGADTLWWDDVEIGDMPPITVDGPYSCPGKGGMVMSVNNPSKSDWYIKKHWFDEKLTLTRDEFGVYHIPDMDEREAMDRKAEMEQMMRLRPRPKDDMKEEDRKKKPDPGMDNSPVAVRGKAFFDNYTGRDAAMRAIYNWIGDEGRVVNLSWCIGSHDTTEQGIPDHPNRDKWLKSIPGMENRRTEVHGEEGDLSVNRLYVNQKRIDEEGRHLVDIIWWNETIEGQIFTEGTATVQLRTRDYK